MPTLVAGLVLFLGAHTVRVWGSGLRDRLVDRLGPGGWRGAYSVVALVGLALIVWGYGEARQTPSFLWALPVGARHGGSLLVLFAFVLLAAAYVPGTKLKAAVGHPMMVGTGLWAVAHLLSNGTVADLVLFGSFLGWIAVGLPAAWRRDRRAGVRHGPGRLRQDAIAVAVGVGLWVAMAFWLHRWLFGVAPFG